MSGSLVAVTLGLPVAEVATSEATIQHLIFVGFSAVAVLIAAWSIVTARARPRAAGLRVIPRDRVRELDVFKSSKAWSPSSTPKCSPPDASTGPRAGTRH